MTLRGLISETLTHVCFGAILGGDTVDPAACSSRAGPLGFEDLTMIAIAINGAAHNIAMAVANLKDRVRFCERAIPERAAARRLANCGARRWSSRLISRHSCRIRFSSPFRFIKRF